MDICSTMKEAYIFDTVRTPRGKGKTNGTLYEVRPIQLLKIVLDALVERNQLNTNEIDDAIIGTVTPVGDQGGDIAKAGLLYAGWSDKVGGVQINRFCTSGLEAINLAATKIRSGWEDMIVAGGVESMSRVRMVSDSGALMFDPDVINSVGYMPQGVSADLIATLEGYSRQEVDQQALLSNQRARLAQQNNYFEKSLIPIKDINGLTILDRDEYIYPDTSLEALSALPLSFEEAGLFGFDAIAAKKYAMIEKMRHVHTAGNSSGMADGAAVTLVGTKEKGEAMGLKPRAKIISLGAVSCEPTLMLKGAVPAIHKALNRAKMSIKDIDLWEINEAFAAVILSTQQELGIDNERLNVNGGAIAMGHPLGATGTMLLATLLDELERRNLNTGVVALPAAGGMGVATVIERV
jgi:acetyl-CoA C-acetyltransferase